LALSASALLAACTRRLAAPLAAAPPADAEALLADLEERTFRFFWERANPRNGLIPDRWPSPSFSSIAAVGFGLTAYPIGVARGWVSRTAAVERVLATLRFFATAPQGEAAAGMTGHRGFYYHFLDMETGERYRDVELSTIDTALLLAGVLAAQSYFDGAGGDEAEIRALADDLYARADWTWVQVRPPAVSHGWRPEHGFIAYDWKGFNEAMILYVLALGSPTHAVGPEAWEAFTSTYRWADFHGYEHVNFAPLFGHQYSHVWIDFRGIQDEALRRRGIDYFENSRRATLAQRAYAIANPGRFRDYGENVWGLSACDGPLDVELEVDGRKVRFFTYAARGAASTEVRDDGTIAPTAAASSIPFAPRETIAAVAEMARRYGADLYGQYGFLDAFNPTFDLARAVQHGRVVEGKGWFDTDYLGIDQGPILAMIENYRSGMVWDLMRKNPHIVRGLERAGFTGGWLEKVTTTAVPALSS
jgi:hypothetical protein